MKIIQINATAGIGSTGKICVSISDLLNKNQIENYIICRKKKENNKNVISIFPEPYYKIMALKEKIFGTYGFEAKLATKKIIDKIKTIKPDIVHLHNLHSHDINLEKLLSFLELQKIKVVWTFHDCWAFTGYCEYFDYINCNKWIGGCEHCEFRKNRSWLIDKSAKLWNKKKKLIKDLDLTIVTPSEWLAKITQKSFFGEKQIKVINNGIDLTIFRPTISDLKKQLKIGDKFIILGVAFDWGGRKGLDDFIELNSMLDKNKYQIILVGIQKQEHQNLPNNIITIEKTNNQHDLAKLYSIADVFFNPTKEDNFPTVNIEALACGLPVVTYNTGGSPEIINEKTGVCIMDNSVVTSHKAIKQICEEKTIIKDDCVQRSKIFDNNLKYKEYIALYQLVNGGENN